MTFGEKVKVCRKAFDITQDQLAEKLHTTKQVISRYESGQRIPKVTVAQEYAKALNIPLSPLIDPNIDMCIWEHLDLLEDYFNANVADRCMLVERRGLDPRVAADYYAIKEESTPTLVGERSISDDDIMFALWGDTSEVDKDDLEDVKRYAAFVRERKQKK